MELCEGLITLKPKEHITYAVIIVLPMTYSAWMHILELSALQLQDGEGL